MKVILYMAITPNGFIAKLDNDTSWISSQEWNSYSANTREVGNLVVGQRTEENLIDEIYFDIEPIIFGKGIQIFHDKDFENKLELLEVKNITENETQLHYRIIQ